MGKTEEVPPLTDGMVASELGFEVTASGVGDTHAFKATASGPEAMGLADVVVPGMAGMGLVGELNEAEVGGSGTAGAIVKLD